MPKSKAGDELFDSIKAKLEQRRKEPGTCEQRRCNAPAEYFQYLGNNPNAYCRRHALKAAAYWDSLGFPSPSYVRLSNGEIFIAGPVSKVSPRTET